MDTATVPQPHAGRPRLPVAVAVAVAVCVLELSDVFVFNSGGHYEGSR